MTNEMIVTEGSPEQLIALALNQQADPTVLSKLMDLQERWEAQNARRAFVLAMSAFKQEAPAVLKKSASVDYTSTKGRTAYSYADLGSIVQEITSVLGKHQLSATWQTAQDEKGNITVTCNVTHAAGHRESVTLSGPPDESGNKNRIQAIGSAVTYLQRYTLLAALGLATADDDDNGAKKPVVKQPQETPAAPETVTTGVDNVVIRPIKKKDGSKGIKYVIHAGEEYETFSETAANDAKRASQAGLMVTITWHQTKYAREIDSLVVQEPAK